MEESQKRKIPLLPQVEVDRIEVTALSFNNYCDYLKKQERVLSNKACSEICKALMIELVSQEKITVENNRSKRENVWICLKNQVDNSFPLQIYLSYAGVLLSSKLDMLSVAAFFGAWILLDNRSYDILRAGIVSLKAATKDDQNFPDRLKEFFSNLVTIANVNSPNFIQTPPKTLCSRPDVKNFEGIAYQFFGPLILQY